MYVYVLRGLPRLGLGDCHTLLGFSQKPEALKFFPDIFLTNSLLKDLVLEEVSGCFDSMLFCGLCKGIQSTSRCSWCDNDDVIRLLAFCRYVSARRLFTGGRTSSSEWSVFPMPTYQKSLQDSYCEYRATCQRSNLCRSSLTSHISPDDSVALPTLYGL